MKSISKYLMLFCTSVALLLSSCSSNDDAPDELEIGDFHKGGVIFYLDSTKDHGLVCAVLDQSAAAEWGCFGNIVNTDANGDVAIGTGSQNTLNIESACNTVGTAADLASNLTLNSYSDWFLPSKDELNQLYINNTLINETALDNGGTALESSDYWSSTQDGSLNAWNQNLTNGNQGTGNKDQILYVRSVRSF